MRCLDERNQNKKEQSGRNETLCRRMSAAGNAALLQMMPEPKTTDDEEDIKEDFISDSETESVPGEEAARDYLEFYLKESENLVYKAEDHQILEAHPEMDDGNCHGYTVNQAVSTLSGEIFLEPGIEQRIQANTLVFEGKNGRIHHSGVQEGGWIRHYLKGVGILRSKLDVIQACYSRMYVLPQQLKKLKARQDNALARDRMDVAVISWAMEQQKIDFPNRDYIEQMIRKAQRMDPDEYGRPEVRFKYKPIEEACRAYDDAYMAYMNQILGWDEDEDDEAAIRNLLDMADASHAFLWRVRGVLPDKAQPYESLRLKMMEEEARARRVAAARQVHQ